MKRKIVLKWSESKYNEKSERVGAMYCFKRCDVNQN